jgi:type IV pilus assembly protein PilB
MASRMRIGELLVAANVITQEQLARALAHPRKEGERLGDVLLGLEMVSDTQLTQALSQQLAVPWVSLYHVDFSRQLLNFVPREIAEKYCLVPVLHRKSKKGGEQLFVAMDDPTNDVAIEEVAKFTSITVKPMIAARSDIRAAIRVYYHGETSGLDAPPPPPQAPPAPPSPKPAIPKKDTMAAPSTLPPEELLEDAPPSEELPPSAPVPSVDSPTASPEIEAKEISLPKRAVPMISLTLLDGTTIQLPARKGRSPSSPAPSETDLTARDLVSALRAVSHGADAADILGEAPKWEPIVAALLSVMLRKGLIADWEFLDEYRKI